LKKGNITIIQKFNSTYIYQITESKLINSVILINNDIEFLKFTDLLDDLNNLSTFTRKLKNQEYIFMNGDLIVKKLDRKSKFIKSIKYDKDIINKFLTLDIETRVIENDIIPYAICFFDGKISKSFYLTDFDNEQNMLKEAIMNLFKDKYHNHIVYVHNLSFFDGIFLMKTLSSIDNLSIRPLIKDGKMFNIELIFYEIKISLRDSLLMLPNSLSKLAIQFDVENKGIFPYDFANIVDLNYIGKVPNFKYFIDITKDTFSNYCKDFPYPN